MPGAYTELRAWKQGVDLVLEVYRATQNFPKAEQYGLTNLTTAQTASFAVQTEQLAKTLNALLNVVTGKTEGKLKKTNAQIA